MKDIRKKIYISFLILIVVSVLGLGLIWQFLWTPFIELKDQYSANRIELNKLNKKASLKQTLEKELESINDNIDVIENSLLSEGETLAFLESVEKIAQNTNSTYEVLSVREVRESEEDSNLVAIVFHIELEGSFPDALQFFRGLKELPYIMNVTDLLVEKKNVPIGQEDFGTVFIRTSLKVYTI